MHVLFHIILHNTSLGSVDAWTVENKLLANNTSYNLKKLVMSLLNLSSLSCGAAISITLPNLVIPIWIELSTFLSMKSWHNLGISRMS